MRQARQPLRTGVIGCGFFARNHLNAWLEIPEVRLAAVCDVDATKAQNAAGEFDVPAWYDDAATMLNEVQLDFVDVATTPESHRGLVELAAEHRLPVICQKPLAFEFKDAEAMVEACQRAGVTLMVHENFRWQAPMRALRRRLDAGAIGRPFYGTISWRTGYDVFAGQPYLYGQPRLVVLDMGGHLIDLARFFLGAPQALVCHTVRVRPGIRGEDDATMLLEYDDAACVVTMAYSARLAEELFPQTLVHLEGEDGMLELGPHYTLTLARRDGTVEQERIAIPPHSWATPPWDVVQDSVVEAQRHWVECLQTGKTPENSGKENLLTLQLVEGAYTSAETQSVYRPPTGIRAL